jgi:lysophospholipase L1-like esterase
VRKICVSGKFSYEAAYVGNDAAITPGPGLATAKVISAGTSVTFDLRDSVDTAVYRTIKLLYHQTVQAQTVLFSIDGGEPFPVTVTGLTPGPAAIEVRSPRPMSRLTIQFADEEFKWQGIELPQRDETRLTMDVFGYPGATVAGFQKSNIDYWSRWFANQHYDLVMLWFGTNEGNVANFDPQAYEYLLSDALSRVKLVFPHSACLLISPADRGVVTHLVTGKRRKRLKLSARRSALLKYSLIHSQIAHVQAKVAAQWGCSAYNLQAAMGGQGSAYAWSKSQPRKMATDLIHFTPVGYRELADDLARAIHWDASWFNAQRSHSETSDP